MFRCSAFGISIGLSLCVLAMPGNAGEKGAKKVAAALNFRMAGLDGKEVDLAKFQGSVVLIVNVASECGYTPQYKSLQALYAKHAKKGLVIIGVPCNQFGEQEPGSNQEIAEFCEKNYGVTFPMLAKVNVNGKDACPLFKYLTSKDTNPKFAGNIGWNFEKFLIARSGEVVGRFPSKVDPEDESFQKVILEELNKK
jgi:glutathione peroxidase